MRDVCAGRTFGGKIDHRFFPWAGLEGQIGALQKRRFGRKQVKPAAVLRAEAFDGLRRELPGLPYFSQFRVAFGRERGLQDGNEQPVNADDRKR